MIEFYISKDGAVEYLLFRLESKLNYDYHDVEDIVLIVNYSKRSYEEYDELLDTDVKL